MEERLHQRILEQLEIDRRTITPIGENGPCGWASSLQAMHNKAVMERVRRGELGQEEVIVRR